MNLTALKITLVNVHHGVMKFVDQVVEQDVTSKPLPSSLMTFLFPKRKCVRNQAFCLLLSRVGSGDGVGVKGTGTFGHIRFPCTTISLNQLSRVKKLSLSEFPDFNVPSR